MTLPNTPRDGGRTEQRRPAQPPVPPPPALRDRPMPVDPARMLHQIPPPRPRIRLSLIAWIVAGLVMAELAGPVAYKPSTVAGAAAARFYGDVMDEDNRKQLELLEQQRIAELLAEREAEYGAWIGRCAMLSLFERQAGAVCRQAAENFYRHAIEEARKARERFKEQKR